MFGDFRHHESTHVDVSELYFFLSHFEGIIGVFFQYDVRLVDSFDWLFDYPLLFEWFGQLILVSSQKDRVAPAVGFGQWGDLVGAEQGLCRGLDEGDVCCLHWEKIFKLEILSFYGQDSFPEEGFIFLQLKPFVFQLGYFLSTKHDGLEGCLVFDIVEILFEEKLGLFFVTNILNRTP